jgi:prepilin-type N-terminal cleavage/methylation domain-containing protein
MAAMKALGARPVLVDSRPRSGFTLIEVVVASVIMVVLAAITIPQVMDALDKKRIEDTYNILMELQYGFVNSQQTGFMNIVRTGASATNTSAVPGKLTQLSEPIISQNVNYPNSCGTGLTGGTGYYNTTAATTWTLGGPFIDRVVSATDGLALPIGQLQNTLVRTPAFPTAPAWIQMRINNVDPNDAAALDLRIDGVAGPAAGTIQYTTAAGVSTVNYFIPVANRC